MLAFWYSDVMPDLRYDANENVGRGERIRTSDPLNPIEVRYQAALRPDMFFTSGIPRSRERARLDGNCAFGQHQQWPSGWNGAGKSLR